MAGRNRYYDINLSTASINEAQASDIASAGTVNIGAARGNFIEITGTTTITAFDTVQAGVRRILYFQDALTLTHSASLSLPSASNITTEAGDIAVFVSRGSGNWVCIAYTKVDGEAVVGGPGGGANELSDLTDVADSNPSNRRVLVADGTDFHSRLLTEADISDLQSYLTVETNDLSSAVTWDDVPDANITQSSVTQHQAALVITESQISDLQNYLLATDIDTLAELNAIVTDATLVSDAPSDGSQYARQNGAWVVVSGGGGASQLSDLSDVADSTPTDRNVLVADGADFHSRALTEADISDLQSYLTSETNDLSAAVVWTTVPDAFISQSSVAQHIDTLAELNSIVTDATLIDDAPSDGNTYGRNNGAWAITSGGGASELSDLSDVNTSTPTNRNVLIADGVDWESRALVEADISDLQSYVLPTDIDTLAEINAILIDGSTLISDAPQDGNTYGRNNGAWVLAGIGGPTDLNDLDDVVITGVDQGDILYYNGTNWVNLGAGSSGTVLTSNGVSSNPSWNSLLTPPTQLSDLNDVNTSTPTNRNVLVADGVDFESRALVEADISDLQSYITDSSTDTLTNKTIDGDSNTLSNLDIGNEVDWPVAADVADATAFESGDKLLVHEAGVGLRKIDYDDLPSGGGGGTSYITITGGTVNQDTALNVGRITLPSSTNGGYHHSNTTDLGYSSTITLSSSLKWGTFFVPENISSIHVKGNVFSPDADETDPGDIEVVLYRSTVADFNYSSTAAASFTELTTASIGSYDAEESGLFAIDHTASILENERIWLAIHNVSAINGEYKINYIIYGVVA